MSRGRLDITKDEVKELWRHVLRSPEVGEEWRTPPEWASRNKKFLKGRHLVLDKIGLGLSLRLTLICIHLGVSGQKLFESAKSYVNGDKNTTNFAKLTQLYNEGGNYQRRNYFYQDGIVELINEKRRSDGINSLIRQDAVFNESYDGEDAVDRFLRKLAEPCWESEAFVVPSPRDVSPKEETLVAMPGDLRDVDEPVSLTTIQADWGPMFINVFAEDAWSELSSYAVDLARSLQVRGEKRLLLSVNLRRSPLPPGHSRPAWTENEDGHILNLPELIVRLHDFCQNHEKFEQRQQARQPSLSISSGKTTSTSPFNYRQPPLPTAEVLARYIQEIRTSLIRSPKIIIIHGFRKDDDENRRLKRHIVDDDVEGFLLKLLEPPICGTIDPLSLQDFQRNRIIVTSNGRLDKLIDQSIRDLPGSRRPISTPLPPPPRHLRHERWAALPLFHPDETLNYMKKDGLRGRRSNIVHLLDASVGIIAASGNQGDFLASLDSTVASITEESLRPEKEIIRCLLAGLGRWRPLWSDLLKLASLSPDGIRQATIHRLARRSMLMNEAFVPFQSIADAERSGTLGTEIQALLQAARPLIGLYRNDSLDEVDELQHPFELGLRTMAEIRPPILDDSRAIDFLYPEFKVIVRAQAFGRSNQIKYHAAHWLLAEESLQQQTISLRHVDGTSTAQSIRSWRRMLGAIFHGLQSLPITMIDSKSVSIRNVDFGAQDMISTANARELWLYLYAFCYRRMIERPPAWNLVRFYGIDDLKVELLNCFDQPWRLWSEGISKPPSDDASLFRTYTAQSQRDDLERDHRFAAMQANTALGGLGKARVILARCDVERGGRIDLGLLKRLMDLRILECSGFDGLNHDEALLQQLGPEKEKLDAHFVKMTAISRDIVNRGDLSFNESLIRAEDHKIIEDISGKINQWQSSNFADVCDIYYRIAEYHATRADLARAHLYRVNQGAEQASSIAILKEFPFDRADAVSEEFCRSMTIYRFAEQLRLYNFRLHPLGSSFFASGHTVRLSIRVALRLERLSRDAAKSNGDGINRFGPFAVYARRMADTLTRHLFRYPRERASQLIIEAAMLRLLSFDDDKLENLKLARDFLGRAEALIVALGHKARVRMRLALERAKLNRDLAVGLKAINPAKALIHLDHCEYDVLVLEQTSRVFGLPIWEELAKIQRDRLTGTKIFLQSTRNPERRM